VIVLYSFINADPLVYLFAWLTTIGGLGVLILMWAASAAVIAFFMLSLVLDATVIGLGDILQVPVGSTFRWIFPVGYAVAAVLGMGWALIMRRTRPHAYAVIGRGGDGRALIELPELARPHSHSVPVNSQMPSIR